MRHFTQDFIDRRFIPWKEFLFTKSEDIKRYPHVIHLIYKEMPLDRDGYNLLSEWEQPSKSKIALNLLIVRETIGYSLYLYRSQEGKLLPEAFKVVCKSFNESELYSLGTIDDTNRTIALLAGTMQDGEISHYMPQPPAKIIVLGSLEIKKRSDLLPVDIGFA